MKHHFLAISALILMPAVSAKVTDCAPVAQESFSGEFSVNSITKDQTVICGFDPSGAFYDKVFRIPVLRETKKALSMSIAQKIRHRSISKNSQKKISDAVLKADLGRSLKENR